MLPSEIPRDYYPILLVSALAALAVYIHFKKFSFWSSRGIRGPTPWPFMGTNIYYFFRHKIYLDQEWQQKYGKTYGLYDGYSPTLRTCDADLIKHVCIKDFSNFTDRNTKLIFSPNVKRWIFFLHGEDWYRQRSLMSPLFTSAKLRSMFSVITNSVSRFIQEIDSRLDKGTSIDEIKSDKEIVCNKDELMSLSLDVASSSLFSIKLDTYHDKTSEFYKRAFAFASLDFWWFIIWSLIPSSISRYFEIDLTRYSKYEFFDKLGQKQILERRKEVKGQAKNDYIQALMDSEVLNGSWKPKTNESVPSSNNQELNKAKIQGQTVKLSDLDIRASINFLFLAGFETTSNTLSYCLKVLAELPDIQDEIHQELTKAIGEEKTIDYDTLMGLKKLDAFVNEVMRLFSVVTTINRLVTNKEGVVLPTNPPIRVPYQTAIDINGFIVQRDPDYWPNPEQFDMTRFYPENRDNIVSGSYLAFGIGQRNCAGKRFALLVIKTVLARSLINYRFSPALRGSKHSRPEFLNHPFFLILQKSEFCIQRRSC